MKKIKKKYIDFSQNRKGPNGLPLGLHADWNDCLRLGKDGESAFAGMQLHLAMKIMLEFAIIKGDLSYAEYLLEEKDKLYDVINRACFDEDRYIRGIRDGNIKIGSRKDKEASLWLNPQTWSVLSGIADQARRRIVLDNVYHNLNTKYGARLMAPSFKEHGFPGALACVYNGSTKENNYSVPTRYIRKEVTIKGYADEVFILYEGKPIATYQRSYGSGNTQYRLEHYIDLLERKSRAVFNAKPVRDNITKELLDWGKILPGGNKEMVKLLRLCLDYGEDKILSIKRSIPSHIIPTVDIVRSCLNEPLETPVIYLNQDIEVLETDLTKYDRKFGVVK
jgi:hypothetical protein